MKLQQLSQQVAARKKMVDARNTQIAAAKADMQKQEAAVVKAKAELATAEAAVKTREAEKKAAEEGVKKADAATKPANKNLRTVSVPVRINVHPTPGKLTASVPGGGALKKGASVDVKVVLARKNNFAGPVTVQLALPEGVTSVTSNTVTIAADATESNLKLTAASTAAAGDISNAVIRATADFGGRKASFDAPIGLKVTE